MNPQSLDAAQQFMRYARIHKLGRQSLHLLLIVSKAQILTMTTAAEKMRVTYQSLYNPIERLTFTGLINVHRNTRTQRIEGLSLTAEARRDLAQIFPHPKTPA